MGELILFLLMTLSSFSHEIHLIIGILGENLQFINGFLAPSFRHICVHICKCACTCTCVGGKKRRVVRPMRIYLEEDFTSLSYHVSNIIKESS